MFKYAHRMSAVFSEEEGQNLLEYTLLLGVIAVGAIVALGTFSSTFTNLLYTLELKAAAIWPS